MQEKRCKNQKILTFEGFIWIPQTTHTGQMGMLVTFDCESIYLSKSGIIHKPYLKSLQDTIFSLIIFIKPFLHWHYKIVAILALLDYVSRAHEIRPPACLWHQLSLNEPIIWISFQILLLVTLVHTPGHFFLILGGKMGFLRILSFFLFFNRGPRGSKSFKMLLLQIAAEIFQNSPESSSQWCSLKYCLGVLKF